MDLSESRLEAVRSARVARLATADAHGRPSVVPICFAIVDGAVVSPVDEKPKEGNTSHLRRVRDVRSNPFVAVLVDQYSEDWGELWWVQIRGQAELVEPRETGHAKAVSSLQDKYAQYADHSLSSRPVVRICPGHVVSWSFNDSGADS